MVSKTFAFEISQHYRLLQLRHLSSNIYSTSCIFRKIIIISHSSTYSIVNVIDIFCELTSSNSSSVGVLVKHGTGLTSLQRNKNRLMITLLYKPCKIENFCHKSCYLKPSSNLFYERNAITRAGFTIWHSTRSPVLRW